MLSIKSFIDRTGNEVIVNPNEFYYLEQGYYYDDEGEMQSCDRYCIGHDAEGDGLSAWLSITGHYDNNTKTWTHEAVEVEEAFV